jgi:hypothetical protein
MAAIIAGILGVGILGIGTFGILSVLLKQSPATPVPPDETGPRTFQYWNQVALAVQSVEPTADRFTITASGAAAQIISQPTVGVDAEAIQCATNVATLMQNIVANRERLSDPATFFQALIRGANGDPFGPVSELMEADSTLKEQFRKVQQQSHATRVYLTGRYGIEFPQLPL